MVHLFEGSCGALVCGLWTFSRAGCRLSWEVGGFGWWFGRWSSWGGVNTRSGGSVV